MYIPYSHSYQIACLFYALKFPEIIPYIITKNSVSGLPKEKMIYHKQRKWSQMQDEASCFLKTRQFLEIRLPSH